MDYSLNGVWQMRRSSDGAVLDARIPGTDFGALIAAGEIENPLISGVEQEALKVAEDSYSFRKSFLVTDEMLQKKYAFLHCTTVDTLCDCFINGQKAFCSQSAYIPIKQDVRPFLQPGENTIEFCFRSPYRYIKERYEKEPLFPNSNGVNGIPYIRKPGCHFGWDWGPCVPYCGILDDIGLRFCDKPLGEIRVRQSGTKSEITVYVHAEGAERIALFSPTGEEIPGQDGTFTVKNPLLWYTHDISGQQKQPLYTLKAQNSELCREIKIGLRMISLDTSADRYGSNFRFVLNGEGVFAKGANLIPFSALFEDSNKSTVDYYIALAKKSGFNMLRVWGGGSYASDYLLKRCDEEGILIWQDFCFACQLYPLYEDDFKALVKKEVRDNVVRLDTHPCVALWCGNNEIEAMFSYVPRASKSVRAYIDFSYRELADMVKVLTDVPYIPSSPLGTKPFENNTADGIGDTHMWNVWHGLKKTDYYQNRYTRFLSEFGLESLPGMGAIETFAEPKDFCMDSEPFMHHQKCKGGNRKMLFYLTELFDFPKDFSALPYLTGLVQAECVKNAAVHFRQNKGRCNGCLYWQFNDVWNCPSWSSVDFMGVPKALQYACTYFYAPVGLTCRKENGRARVAAHNDTLYPVSFQAKLEWWNAHGEKIKERTIPVFLEKNSYAILTDFAVRPDEVLRLSWGNQTITELFTAPRLFPLEKAELSVKKEGNSLVLKSNTFAYAVCVQADAVAEENYFSLMKDEEKRISFQGELNEYRILCANNIEYRKKPLRRKAFRLCYRLEPANIANAVAYSVM